MDRPPEVRNARVSRLCVSRSPRRRRRRRLRERTGSPTSLNPETEWPAEEFTQLEALVIRTNRFLKSISYR